MEDYLNLRRVFGMGNFRESENGYMGVWTHRKLPGIRMRKMVTWKRD